MIGIKFLNYFLLTAMQLSGNFTQLLQPVTGARLYFGMECILSSHCGCYVLPHLGLIKECIFNDYHLISCRLSPFSITIKNIFISYKNRSTILFYFFKKRKWQALLPLKALLNVQYMPLSDLVGTTAYVQALKDLSILFHIQL